MVLGVGLVSVVLLAVVGENQAARIAPRHVVLQIVRNAPVDSCREEVC
jgi:hypothetical protein